MENRLKMQVDFIIEIDKLKRIVRQSYLTDNIRKENDAEHSWHLAMLAIILKEYSDSEIDILKIIKMVLIHDLVEIDAGDTYAYDSKGNQDKWERESKAAERIFGVLPKDQKEEMQGIWLEFEQGKTSEAKFAAAIDRIEPILLNYLSKGKAWKEHGVKKDQVMERNKVIKDASIELWEFIKEIIEESVINGYLSV